MSNSEKLYDIFVSYKNEDSDWVGKLKSDLNERGLTVWMDRDNIRPGDLFAQALENGLESSKCVGLVVTPESIDSNWVKEEYYRALSLANTKQLHLIPLLLRNTKLPGFLSSRHCIDFSNPSNYESNLDKLIWPGITGKHVSFFVIDGYVNCNLSNAFEYEFLRNKDTSTVRGYQSGGSTPTFELIRGDGPSRSKDAIKYRLEEYPSTRLVVVINLFEGSIPVEEYIHFLFDLRDKTKGTRNEPVFLLFHDSNIWQLEYTKLESKVARRLSHYFMLDQNPELIEETIHSTWLRIQRELIKTNREI